MNKKLFLERYTELGAVFEPEAISVQPCLRVNTLKILPGALRQRLEKSEVSLAEVPFLENAFYYKAKFSLGATPEYLLGYYYLQDAASQLPAAVLAPVPGDMTLDMAASPGGKTTQMAAMMQNKGTLVAIDVSVHRLAALKNNLERLGVTNTVVYKKDARFAFDLKMKFDKVLLDAPCSGNFCIEPAFFEQKTLQGISERAKLQKELFKAAVKVLKPGGTLVYSTCSLEPEEDELVVDWALRKFPELSLEDTGLDKVQGDSGLVSVFGQQLSPEISMCRRFWPHKTGTEGFFIAKFIKKAETGNVTGNVTRNVGG